MKMTHENIKKIRKLGPNAMCAYHKGTVKDNTQRLGGCKFKWVDFNEKILKIAAKAGHIVLYSGMDADGECDEAYLKRKDGSIFGVAGVDVQGYENDPKNYRTKDPESYTWAPNFGGWVSNNGFLS